MNTKGPSQQFLRLWLPGFLGLRYAGIEAERTAARPPETSAYREAVIQQAVRVEKLRQEAERG